MCLGEQLGVRKDAGFVPYWEAIGEARSKFERSKLFQPSGLHDMFDGPRQGEPTPESNFAEVIDRLDALGWTFQGVAQRDFVWAATASFVHPWTAFFMPYMTISIIRFSHEGDAALYRLQYEV